MPNADIRLRVLLRPDDGAGRQPWPCPPGVTLELQRKGSGATATASATHQVTTQAEGMTEPVQLAEGTYQVISIAGLPGSTWWEPKQLKVPRRTASANPAGQEDQVGDAEERLEVELVPKDGYRLLVARLVTEDGEHVPGAAMAITAAGEPAFDETFGPCSDGTIYAVAPKGMVTLAFESVEVNGKPYCPQAFAIPYPVATLAEVKALEFMYWPQVTIFAKPTITTGTNTVPQPLVGTNVTVEYRRSAPAEGKLVLTKMLSQDDSDGMISFDFAFPGHYTAIVKAPDTWDNLPIENQFVEQSQNLEPGGCWEIPAAFSVVATEPITIAVQLPPAQQLDSDVNFSVNYGKGSMPIVVSSASGQGSALVPAGETLTLSLAATPTTKAGNLPLQMETPNQVLTTGGTNSVVLEYEYSITITAVDERGQPVQGVMIQAFDQNRTPVGSGITNPQGILLIGVPSDGPYYLAERSVAGEAMRLTPVTVNSPAEVKFKVQRRGSGSAAGGEALTDLSAYPVLTEEITTTGPPAPAGGGAGSGAPGAGYGQTVDQVMRDVLGWRPSGDVAGFQAALAGAFQLREVEGHTEWSWQQRGYAVQADMGALTGAQASIYARAKSALDQMLPLLAGLTTLNPAAWPPQDLEAIRTVIAAELQELVNELALEGGPRIQRVDELFRLLTGESRKSVNPNPDVVQGQLGTMRDRFCLTVAYVDTVDEERIVTNFRIVVEQVLTLKESWESDRKLLSVLDSNTSLGTILIWLSRGLEAVCESVDDLTFALDSVFVDAAQRQVIPLDFTGLAVRLPELPLWRGKTSVKTFEGRQAPILLSDLLDWVTRASRDEGPRIVQDAGKDGVAAFFPVLNELRALIHATRKVTDNHTDATLPDGMRTPRVRRALDVLAGQLDEAANLAGLVRRDAAPEIFDASAAPASTPGQMEVTLTGINFRRNSSVYLYAANREDIADIPARHVQFGGPTTVMARFRTLKREDAGGRLSWQVVLTNEDGAATEPAVLDLRQLFD